MKYPAALILFLPFLLFPSSARPGGRESVTLALSDALQTAMTQNLSLAQAQLESERAEKAMEISFRERFPRLSLEGTYTRLGLPESSSSPIPGIGQPDSDADLSLSLSLPLYTGGRLRAAYRQGAVNLELARAAANSARDDVLLETAGAFYELATAQQMVEIAREVLESSRRHRADVASLHRQGIVAKVDLYRSELDVAERESDFAAAEAQVIHRGEHLSSLLYPDEFVEVTVTWDGKEPAEPAGRETWFRLAEERSPELHRARHIRDLAEAGVKAARAARWPSLSLFGAYGAQGEEFTLDDEDRYWNAGLAFSLPLYTGKRAVLEIERAKIALTQAGNEFSRARRRVRRAVVVAHADTRLALRQHAAAVKAVAAAEENGRVTELKYQQGLIANTDVIDALLSLSRARFGLARALKNYHTGMARLMRAAGVMEDIL